MMKVVGIFILMCLAEARRSDPAKPIAKRSDATNNSAHSSSGTYQSISDRKQAATVLKQAKKAEKHAELTKPRTAQQVQESWKFKIDNAVATNINADDYRIPQHDFTTMLSKPREDVDTKLQNLRESYTINSAYKVNSSYKEYFGKAMTILTMFKDAWERFHKRGRLSRNDPLHVVIEENMTNWINVLGEISLEHNRWLIKVNESVRTDLYSKALRAIPPAGPNFLPIHIEYEKLKIAAECQHIEEALNSAQKYASPASTIKKTEYPILGAISKSKFPEYRTFLDNYEEARKCKVVQVLRLQKAVFKLKLKQKYQSRYSKVAVDLKNNMDELLQVYLTGNYDEEIIQRIHAKTVEIAKKAGVDVSEGDVMSPKPAASPSHSSVIRKVSS
eukprot:Platyproteum_vivax@DN4591_c0_g1_i2.p1